MVGLESAASSLLRAGATVAGSIAIASGDYFLPFAITATCYLLSTGLFWFWFRGAERSAPRPVLVAAT